MGAPTTRVGLRVPLKVSDRRRILVRPEEFLPCRPRRGDFFLEFLLGAFADRREVHRSLDVLFKRRHLFAADNYACDGLAEIEL